MVHPSGLSAEEYRALVEHSPVMIWRAGLDAKCDYFNQTWLSFTGRTLEQEMGNGWAEGVHPDDFQRCLDIYLKNFERRQAFEMEYRLRRHDGVYRYIFDRGVPFTDDHGVFAGFIGSCVDIDERRQTDQAKANFLSLIAHELRTPITAVQTYLEVFQRKLEGPHPPGPEMFQRLAQQMERLKTLVNDLGYTARIEQGTPLPMQLRPFNFSDLVRQIFDFYVQSLPLRRSSSGRHVLSFVTEERRFPVLGDPDRLHQVLVNLFENAIKYTPEGGEIVVRLSTEGKELRLSVSDPGIGIPPEELSQLSRRYYRASNADPSQFQGLGLGLTISREILEQHGGRLEFASVLRRGTTVTMVLPAAA
ncbi:MAG TPA: PAS domain-containing sensor histidine kinase [Polyangia bacterium]|jgi:two-component system CheB/CheR fusion protein|nr:PAS domain-containing sensor histidine kinase [Polyangia bacterium]